MCDSCLARWCRELSLEVMLRDTAEVVFRWFVSVSTGLESVDNKSGQLFFFRLPLCFNIDNVAARFVVGE